MPGHLSAQSAVILFDGRTTHAHNSNPQPYFSIKAGTTVLGRGRQARCKGPMNILKHPPRHLYQDTGAQPGYQQRLTTAGTQAPQAPRGVGGRGQRPERDGHSPCPGQRVPPAASPSPRRRAAAGSWG